MDFQQESNNVGIQPTGALEQVSVSSVSVDTRMTQNFQLASESLSLQPLEPLYIFSFCLLLLIIGLRIRTLNSSKKATVNDMRVR